MGLNYGIYVDELTPDVAEEIEFEELDRMSELNAQILNSVNSDPKEEKNVLESLRIDEELQYFNEVENEIIVDYFNIEEGKNYAIEDGKIIDKETDKEIDIEELRAEYLRMFYKNEGYDDGVVNEIVKQYKEKYSQNSKLEATNEKKFDSLIDEVLNTTPKYKSKLKQKAKDLCKSSNVIDFYKKLEQWRNSNNPQKTVEEKIMQDNETFSLIPESKRKLIAKENEVSKIESLLTNKFKILKQREQTEEDFKNMLKTLNFFEKKPANEESKKSFNESAANINNSVLKIDKKISFLDNTLEDYYNDFLKNKKLMNDVTEDNILHNNIQALIKADKSDEMLDIVKNSHPEKPKKDASLAFNEIARLCEEIINDIESVQEKIKSLEEKIQNEIENIVKNENLQKNSPENEISSSKNFENEKENNKILDEKPSLKDENEKLEEINKAFKFAKRKM